MLESIEKIRRYTEGMDFPTFSSTPLVVDAVIRNLEVMGEAARHVPEEVGLHVPSVPWRQLRDMRNLVIHEYFGVSLKVVWDTVHHDLEPLVAPLQRALQDNAR